MNWQRLHGYLSYQSLMLGAVVLVTCAALGWAAQRTHDPILAAEAQDLRNNLSRVLPHGSYDNDLLQTRARVDGPEGPLDVYRATLQGKPVAAIFAVHGRGYAGDIEVLLAISPEGALLGARVLKHKETPGLGDKIDVEKNPWITRFQGLSLGNPPLERWAVKKDGGDFDQFAGATITPRAVVKEIREGLEFFASHRQQLFGETLAAGESQ
ncbi:electron transport complex subunit RsxG [Pseudomonas sp. UBA6310]|uniref:electron transport complex subunit RsxG n=1 Tax=Pseudomonas sp. UBA6310 TaxID=1947327 RepID=UPI00257E25BA|nr:electron transport complex subunit RsxG [Pseudomonas sp. UBA6310]